MFDEHKLEVAFEFLRTHRLGSFASIRAEVDSPSLSFHYYYIDSVNTIYIATVKDSMKIANVKKNPKVAFLVAQELPPIVVQIEARAEIVENATERQSHMKRIYDEATANQKSSAWPPLISLSERVGVEVLRLKMTTIKYSSFTTESPVIIEETYTR